MTNILLRVVPDMGGHGHEVYAETVADVEDLLSKLSGKVEDYELGIKTAPRMQAVVEPLRREVAMVRAQLIIMRNAKCDLGDYSDVDSIIEDTQATAFAYEREVKAKAHDIAFECAARIIEGRLRDEPRDVNHEIRKCAAAVRDKGWQIKFLADYEELRASKGEVK